jgi:glycosyltransferase involved in cell wall biosynthesis
MKLAYATTYNAQDLKEFYNWAGLGYYIAQSLKHQSISLDYIGPLGDSIAIRSICKLKRHYHQIFERKNYLRALDPLTLQNYANQVSYKLSRVQSDIVFSATIASTAYLDCDQPIVFWADATFANLLDSYPVYKNLCKETVEHGHKMEKLALNKSALALFASDWAAQTAIDYYQADPSKVKVVPFGANIENQMTFDEIKDLIRLRPSDKCKLLFIGYDWVRKGGDIAVKVTKALNSAGLNTELTVVGCSPSIEESASPFIKTLGIINKSTETGRSLLNRLILESHFLILPSKAECYGLVFCEANSFGVPCLATNVGGIPTIIRDGHNGRTFDKDADIKDYCQYVFHLFTNYSKYEELALSSFNEYQSRLNWSVAGHTARDLLETVI